MRSGKLATEQMAFKRSAVRSRLSPPKATGNDVFSVVFLCEKFEVFRPVATATNCKNTQKYIKHRSHKVKTTGLAGGLHWPYKGLIQLRLKTHERFANRKIFTGCPLPGAAYYLPLTTGSPVNGSLNSLIHIWSLAMSSWSWLRTYSFIVFSLRPTVST